MYRTEALYDERNQLKQNIQFDDNSENKDTTRVFINEKEVWYISL